MYSQATLSPPLLTKALLRAAEQLDLVSKLPALLQVAPEQTTQLQAGERLLDPQQPEWAAALKIVGLFRTMIELVGTAERARSWLGAMNETFDARPIDLLGTPNAELVYRYLSSVRKHELRMPPPLRRGHDELQ